MVHYLRYRSSKIGGPCEAGAVLNDLELAFRMADAADALTLDHWHRDGVASWFKQDGTPVTEADLAAEQAMLDVLRGARPDDGFVGEESGEIASDTSRRWIADGIDGTRFYAGGATTWGTLIALEEEGEVLLGVSSSPAQDRRWWATKGGGTFTAPSRDVTVATRISVSKTPLAGTDRVACLPRFDALSAAQQKIVMGVAGGSVPDCAWSHQNRVAEGLLDLVVWFGGDIWDHAAPSIIVEEAGGRFSDIFGGRRLDTRTAIYSNGLIHDRVIEAVATSM